MVSQGILFGDVYCLHPQAGMGRGEEGTNGGAPPEPAAPCVPAGACGILPGQSSEGPPRHSAG